MTWDRLAAPPHTVVLSACDVGDSAAVGTDEWSGLGHRPARSRGQPCRVGQHCSGLGPGHPERRDALHSSLAAGDGLPTAWLSARRHTRGDALAATTAASPTAWGA
ncbi:MAG: hypothetical protein IPJ15_15205 [Actinomycetales bacterium]|nr:hypothetical protein [Candidatus Phosphoribacter baldrii]